MSYVPNRGEVIWVNFDPQMGHEQAGRRPALVISSARYNRASGLALLCPLTNQAKGYPFEVVVPLGLPVTGVILADQVKSFDWQARNAVYLCTLPVEFVFTVREQVRKMV